MLLSSLLAVLRLAAPESLAQPWDKVGLHVGRTSTKVKKALLCIDLTEAVAAEAKKEKCQLVVAYHPPIFAPLARLTDGSWKERALLACAEAGIAVYSPHTALDAVRGGLTDALCAALGKGTSVPIEPTAPKRDTFKIVVFVPEAQTADVRQAMAAAGAGGIGNYRECAFESPGLGGFLPVAGANPAIGRVGVRETVAETRLEMICPGAALPAVLAALRAAHPYEEPAFDILRLEPEPVPPTLAHGAGRLLTLDTPVSAQILANRLKKAVGVKTLWQAAPAKAKPIRTVAVCPGSGGSLFEKGSAADAYVTGEMQHHGALDLRERGAFVFLAGHTQTERAFLPAVKKLYEKAGAQVEWKISRADTAALK